MEIVSTSRISPIITTSGSWRSAARSPIAKLSVSTPTSRCVTELCLSRCRNSIGFSSVTMCLFALSFTWFTSAAIVLDLPEPVTPVTSTMPRSAAEMRASTGGSRSSSNVGTSNGITRMTIAKLERCRRMLTRKRPIPAAPQPQS